MYPSKALEEVINEEAPFRKKLAASVPAGARVTEGSVKFNGVLAPSSGGFSGADRGASTRAASTRGSASRGGGGGMSRGGGGGGRGGGRR